MVVVACLYTLRISALLGESFNTIDLNQSGLCPAQFWLGQFSTFPLTSVLDILEENDFIEMIDAVGDDRCYRFNHKFLRTAICQSTPYNQFRKRFHTLLALYFENKHPQRGDIQNYVTQLLLLNRVLLK